MKCSECQKELNPRDLSPAQYAVGSMHFICSSCITEGGWVKVQNHVRGGILYVPKTWCAFTLKKRSSCPSGVAYCGSNILCDCDDSGVIVQGIQ
jgi:hypothetical protein